MGWRYLSKCWWRSQRRSYWSYLHVVFSSPILELQLQNTNLFFRLHPSSVQDEPASVCVRARARSLSFPRSVSPI
jgi:hypothetical protein